MTITLTSPQTYTVLLQNMSYQLLGQDGSQQKFSAPASTPNIPKLYVFYDQHCLHYVGITTQRVSVRLLSGLKAKGAHGYHGYKWKGESKLTLSIWTLDGCGDEKISHILETVEAEIVFLYRSKSGKWPQSQHEIHFHNRNDDICKELAQNIFEHIQSKISG
ncbi:MAG: hypothetical protein AB7E85_08320 [Pseudobdellovibrionaceae bacterium]